MKRKKTRKGQGSKKVKKDKARNVYSIVGTARSLFIFLARASAAP
jgi:hypothetical protein